MVSTAYPVFASKHARIPPQFSTLVAKRKGRYHGRGKGTTKAQPTRARLLYERGFTVTEIRQALQISPRTVYRYLATGENA